jgi:polysaccharide biosynthesis transport protein
MELHSYLRIIRKRIRLIIAVIVLCTSVAIGISLATVPVYEGHAKLLVVAKAEPGGGTSSAYEGALLSQQLVKSFAQVLESRATAEVALRLDPQPFTPSDLQNRIHAEPIIDTLLLDLRVWDTNPARAKRLTNSVARAFINTVPSLQRGSTLRVSLVEPALQPTEPVRPRMNLNLLLGMVLGLLIGIGLAILRDMLDKSIETPGELEAAGTAPVVGTIPPFKTARSRIPVMEQPRTGAAEAFRKLRTNFAFLGVDRESVCCVVTSPGIGNGKSTVTANLALALTQAGQRVVIVDADLRKPAQHRIFGLQQRVGVTTVLLDQVDAVDALQRPYPTGPAVLTCGQLPPNPSELLGSQRMAELLHALRGMTDVILIDCPPLLPVTDPMVLSQFADGVLLIVRAGSTSRDEVKAAVAACAKVGATVFGTVLNASRLGDGDQPAYYAYYGDNIRQAATADAGVEMATSNGAPRRTNGTRASRLNRSARFGKQ